MVLGPKRCSSEPRTTPAPIHPHIARSTPFRPSDLPHLTPPPAPHGAFPLLSEAMAGLRGLRSDARARQSPAWPWLCSALGCLGRGARVGWPRRERHFDELGGSTGAASALGLAWCQQVGGFGCPSRSEGLELLV